MNPYAEPVNTTRPLFEGYAYAPKPVLKRNDYIGYFHTHVNLYRPKDKKPYNIGFIGMKLQGTSLEDLDAFKTMLDTKKDNGTWWSTFWNGVNVKVIHR
jgi:hypothetical protein